MTLADYSKTGWAPEKAALVLNKSILGLGKVEVVVSGARVGSFVQAGYGHRRIFGKCLIHKNTLVIVHLLVKARYSYLFHSVSVKLQALVYDILPSTWRNVPESDARSVCVCVNMRVTPKFAVYDYS